MKTVWGVRVEQVVITNIKLRGKGTDLEPYRRVTQVWSFDGELIAECDQLVPMGTEDVEKGSNS